MILSCGKTHKIDIQVNSEKSNVNNSSEETINAKAFPAFPDDTITSRKTNAAEDSINGVAFAFAKGGVNHMDFDDVKAYSIISDDANKVAFAQYVTEAFTNRPTKLLVTVKPTKLNKGDAKDLDISYHVAIANFSSHVWDWFGPYSDDQSIELNSETKRERYLSPTNKLHYVVLVAQSAKGQTIGASVEATQSESSVTAYPTLPLYTGISLIHVGQYIKDPTVKRISALSADQELTLVWYHKEVTIKEDNVSEYEVYANEIGSSSIFIIGKVASPGIDGLVKFKVISDVLDSEKSKFIASKSYNFYIKPKNAQGSARRSLGEYALIPSVLPPTGLSSTTNLETGVQLNWTKSADATGYKIYKDNQSKSIATLGDVNSYLDKSATDGKDHLYWVIALKGKEESGFCMGTTGHSVSLDEPFPTPQNVSASTDLVGRILITWDAVPGAEAYLVKVDGVDDSYGSVINKYLDLKQTDLYDHTYEVCAISKTRPFSQYSSPVKGKMKSIGGILPDLSKIWASTARTDGIELNWSTVPGATSYLIYGTYQYYTLQYQFDITATTFLDLNTIPGESRYYSVFALTNTEKSLNSPFLGGVQLVPGDIYEPDDTLALAKPIAFSSTENSIQRSLHSTIDRDWFVFDAQKDTLYSLYTMSNTGVNAYICNQKGEIVCQDYYSNGPNNNKYLTFQAPTSNKYYILIKGSTGIVIEYYIVYNQGTPPLVSPDLEASSNRTDDVLITYNSIPGADGYNIYRDKLDVPIGTVPNDGTNQFIDIPSDYNEHHYWVTTYNSTSTSKPGIYNKGQRFKPDSYEKDGDSTTATLITPTSDMKSQVRSIAPQGDEDWIKFTGIKDVNYQFWSEGGLDTIISIYDNTLTLLKSDDDAGSGSNFYISFKPTATDQYFLKIKGYSSTRAGNYEFFYTTGLGKVPEFTLITTRNLDTGITISWNQIANIDGYRIYRDSFDNKIAEVGKTDTYSDKDVFDIDSHKYWVQPFNATNDCHYSNLGIGQKVIIDKFEPNDTFNKGTSLNIDSNKTMQTHSIYPAADNDWFSFSATKDHYYNFSLSSLVNTQMNFVIYDTDGTTLLSSKYGNSSLSLTWQAPTTDVYYGKVYLTDPKAILVYRLYVNYSYGDQPLSSPTNLTASSDRTDGIYISWDRVPIANRYTLYLTNPTKGSATREDNNYYLTGVQYSDYEFQVTAVFYYINDQGYPITSESIPSAKAIGKCVREISSNWKFHNISTSAQSVPILQSNGNPALLCFDTTKKLLYLASKVTNPTSNADWVGHSIDAASSINGDIKLIDGKPAVAYHNGTNLIYNYSTKTAPSGMKGDWIKLTLTNLSNGNYVSLAEINKKPAIMYFHNGTLYYIMSKTTIPADATPASWETPVNLGSSLSTEPVTLIPQAVNGFAAFTVVNSEGYPVYGYSTHENPTFLDWKYYILPKKGSSVSFTMLNGCPAISYIPINSTNLTLTYSNSSDPAGLPWLDYIIDSNADSEFKTNIINTKSGYPSIIYVDTESLARVARSLTMKPSSIYDWDINVLDTAVVRDNPKLFETTSVTAVYQTMIDNLVNYSSFIK